MLGRRQPPIEYYSKLFDYECGIAQIPSTDHNAIVMQDYADDIL